MRKIREVLRLKFEQGQGHRSIAVSCGIGVATVGDYLKLAHGVGIGWPDAQKYSDAELEARLFPKAQYGTSVQRATLTSFATSASPSPTQSYELSTRRFGSFTRLRAVGPCSSRV